MSEVDLVIRAGAPDASPTAPACDACRNTRLLRCEACDGLGCGTCDGLGSIECLTCTPPVSVSRELAQARVLRAVEELDEPALELLANALEHRGALAVLEVPASSLSAEQVARASSVVAHALACEFRFAEGVLQRHMILGRLDPWEPEWIGTLERVAAVGELRLLLCQFVASGVPRDPIATLRSRARHGHAWVRAAADRMEQFIARRRPS